MTAPPDPPPMRADPLRRREYVLAVGVVLLTTGLGLALRSYLGTIDVAMLFLLAVVVVASRTRQGPAVAATLLGIAAFDILFVPPYGTFDVRDAAYIPTFGVMLVVALVMSRLTARIRGQAEEATERARAATALAALGRDLAAAEDPAALAGVLARRIERDIGGAATVYLADRPDAPPDPALPWLAGGVADDPAVGATARWVHAHGEPAGRGTGRCEDAGVLVVPVRSASRGLGVVVLRSEQGRPLPPARRRLVAALADEAAVALERALLTARHEAARLEVEGERLRTALLSSLSHDLRTPLASIEGAASGLLAEDAVLPPEARLDLTQTILEESRRMTRLVANLLEMIRVEAGTLAVRKAWQPLEETVGVALLRLEDRLRAHPVEVDLPPDLPLVPMDELLIEQVFINLLENAAKYCPPGTPVTITAARRDDGVVVTVADRGPGIPAEAREAVFEKFRRLPERDGAERGGAGLGLAICRGIMTAHGGRIWVGEVPGGGAAFHLVLPLEGPPVARLPADDAAAGPDPVPAPAP